MDIGFCISHTRLDKSHYIRCNQFKLDDSFGTAAYYRRRRKHTLKRSLLKTMTSISHYTRKNLTTCRKSANKPSTSFVRTACPKLSTSLEQAFNNLQQPC